MTTAKTGPKERWFQKYLDPGDRISEVLFGLIMVLTFTLTAGMSVAEGEEGVRELLVATIGCNLAWGIIDGIFYVMGSLFDRARNLRLAGALRAAPDEDSALAAISRELDPELEEVTTEEGRRRLYREILQVVRRSHPRRNRVLMEDLYGALASFCMVFLSTVPAAVPFLIFRDQPRFALRVSNGLLLGLLFLVGHRWARFTGGRPIATGFVMLLVGCVLVAIAIAFGG